MGSSLERSAERRSGKLGTHGNSESHFRLPDFRSCQQRFGRQLPEQWQQPDPPQPEFAIRCSVTRASVNGSIPVVSSILPLANWGTPRRTPVSGPNFVNTDFSAIKHFVLPCARECGSISGVEVFNLLNHPQFGTPGSGVCASCPQLDTPGFGSINTTVNNPRLVQLALKFLF